MPPVATKSRKAIFSTKVKVRVTRSLTSMSFERALLVEYACQIYKVYISCGSKVKVNVKVDNRQTDKTQTICPNHLIWGHKNLLSSFLQKVIPTQQNVQRTFTLRKTCVKRTLKNIH